MNFLEFAVWGAYLTSMGRYLGNIGMSTDIGLFYSMQGIVSIFMPALMGIIADRWIPAQRLLGLCHLTAGVFMFAAAMYGSYQGADSEFSVLFTLYSLSVAFYMPTLALSNSVAYNALTVAGMDTVKDFPPIRVFGTIGFICSMWFVDLMGFQANQNQFVVSGVLSVLLFAYTFTLPHCPVSSGEAKTSVVDALGLRAFTLFKRKDMAIFFIFKQFRRYSRVCRHLRRAACQHIDITFTDKRNMLYPAHTVFHEALRHKERHAHSHVRLGVAFWTFRLRQSRWRRVDVCSVDDSVWCGFRLFQHQRLALC